MDRTTTELQVARGPGDAIQRERLQRALGDTCEVRRLLGRGGFAEVYVAYDRRLKREIAVKTLRGDVVASDALLQRFQREAEAVAKLRHPNVIPIYAVGEGDGLAYFTMPLVEGESLGAALEREGRLSVAEGCRVLREAAHALHVAHRAGIVHRDVKPENIMLEGPERSVVVMDFGIAKTVGAGQGVGQEGLTDTGLVLGTPQYVSPEQALGERALDARSDQYSLAMVGYRVLAGRLPFADEPIQAQMFKTVTEVPAPLAEVAPDVPPAVSDAIARALAKQPEDRFESMTAFAAALGDAVPNGGAGLVVGRRRPTDMATRVRDMHERLPGLRDPLVVLGALGFILFVVCTWLATPWPAVRMAADRDDALFSARSFLSSRAPEAGQARLTELAVDEAAFRFLYESVGYVELQRRAERDVPVWEWVVEAPDVGWTVKVGARNRVTGFRRSMGHSAADSAVPKAQARARAEREVVERGWALSELEPRPDSTTDRPDLTERSFSWRVRSGALQWRGADSAFVQVDVSVRGDDVREYSEKLQVPGSFPQEHLRGSFLDLTEVIVVVILVPFSLVPAVIAVRRQRVDDLQWNAMLRLFLVAGAVALVSRIPDLVADWGPTSGLFEFGLPLLWQVFAGGLALLAAITGESLTAEQRPRVLRGLADVARGRLLIPEMVPAVARGYLIALVLLGLNALLTLMTLRFVERLRVHGLSDVYFASPVVELLYEPALAVPAILSLLFLIAGSARIRGLGRIAPVIPAALVMLVSHASGADLVEVAREIVWLPVLGVAIWHGDVLLAMVAWLVYHAAESVLPLLQTGTAYYLVSALTLLLVVAAPGMVALRAYRRFARPVAATAPRAARVAAG